MADYKRAFKPLSDSDAIEQYGVGLNGTAITDLLSNSITLQRSITSANFGIRQLTVTYQSVSDGAAKGCFFGLYVCRTGYGATPISGGADATVSLLKSFVLPMNNDVSFVPGHPNTVSQIILINETDPLTVTLKTRDVLFFVMGGATALSTLTLQPASLTTDDIPAVHANDGCFVAIDLIKLTSSAPSSNTQIAKRTKY